MGDGNERTSHPILMCSVVILEVAFAPEFIRYTLGVYAFLVAAFASTLKRQRDPMLSSQKFSRCQVISILGHSFKLIEVYETLQDWALITAEACGWKEFHIRLLRFGHFKNGALVLISPESVKHVLKDNFENYVKGDAFYSTLNEFLGDGIFASDGPTWKLHRKVATGMFSKKLLRNGTEAAMTRQKSLSQRSTTTLRGAKHSTSRKCFTTLQWMCFLSSPLASIWIRKTNRRICKRV